MKIVPTKTTDGYWEYYFWCPGCEQTHGFRTKFLKEPAGLSPEDLKSFRENKWSYNGDPNSPTIHPSLHVKGRKTGTNEDITRCHSFVENGNIRFLTDCRHPLKGQTVPLPDYEASI